jgi:hypothetical protein
MNFRASRRREAAHERGPQPEGTSTSAHDHVRSPDAIDIIARLDRAIQYSRPVFTGSPGRAGRSQRIECVTLNEKRLSRRCRLCRSLA